MKAPVLLFAYNRPAQLERALDALEVNHGFAESPVFVCSDGARVLAERAAIEQVRAVVRRRKHPNLTLIESRENRGLYGSIMHGVTTFVQEFGRVIVVEDDLVTSPFFLDYMNEALERYDTSQRVLQVCGFGVRAELNESIETFFSPLASSWGWATWKRAWEGFTTLDLAGARRRLGDSAELRYRYDLEGRYPMCFLLDRDQGGSPRSWALPWQLYVLCEDGLTLWPTKSLVQNIGSDGLGSHSRWFRKDATMSVTDLAQAPVQSFPREIELDPAVWKVAVEALVAPNPGWHRWLSAWSRRFQFL